MKPITVDKQTHEVAPEYEGDSEEFHERLELTVVNPPVFEPVTFGKAIRTASVLHQLPDQLGPLKVSKRELNTLPLVVGVISAHRPPLELSMH